MATWARPFDDVLRQSGAPSIAMGRTPHEVRDELCCTTFAAAR
jgi:hypothetical protein